MLAQYTAIFVLCSSTIDAAGKEKVLVFFSFYDDVLDCFKLFSCILFRGKYCSKRLKNIFEEFESEPIVALGYKTMMTSSKCLDFNYLELFLDTLFRSNNFSKRLR